jgi:hypothetical protein
VVRETDDKIVVFGHYDYRFDIPESEIIAAGRNVIVGIDFPEILKYKVEREKRTAANRGANRQVGRRRREEGIGAAISQVIYSSSFKACSSPTTINNSKGQFVFC